MPSDPEHDLNFDPDEDAADETPVADADTSGIDAETSGIDADESGIEAETSGIDAAESGIEAEEPEAAVALEEAPEARQEEEAEEEEEERPKKPGQWNVFMVLLAISLLAICISCVTLFLYLTNRYGGYPWWETDEAYPTEGESYHHERDVLGRNRGLAHLGSPTADGSVTLL